ncbi:hypothetical protein EDB89DRAFT_568429 [Lactarius sanguifluus]|nr:hypothetical protein EDB89DRAFT_568429 [Lactarius sanguifluus]
MVVRHPQTRMATLIMSIKFTHTGADNRPKPTIFYFTPTKRLVFCLVTAIAVFAASVSGPVSYTPLRWKELLKRPVFRRCDASDFDSPLPYRTLHEYEYMGRQSLDMGYEKPIGPKDWRRNVGNTVNGQASDAARDKVVRQNNHSNVFQDAYLNANANVRRPERHLGRASADPRARYVGHARDPRATSDMVPDEVWASLPPDPEVVELEQQRAALKGGKYGVQRLNITSD